MGTRERIEDLQSTSSQVMADAERITELEQEKRGVEPGSRRFRELSDEIERIAEHVRVASSAETDIADEVAGTPGLPTMEQADEAAGRD